MASMTSVRALPIVVGTLDDARAGELVVGRNELVARLWDTVKVSNVRVAGARHMGKTWTLKLAAAQHPSWARPILIEAGTCQTVPELVRRLADSLSRSGFVPADWALRVGHWYSKLSSHQPQPPPSAPWSMVLGGTLQHASVHPSHLTAAVIIDGFGAFVDRLCRAGGAENVRKLFDALNAFSTDWPRLRCIVSGDADLDDAIRAAYGAVGSSPIEVSFRRFDVPPLTHEDAHYLAACLLIGESVPCSDLHDVADAVATATGEIPFLIHNTIDWMARFQPGMWTPERVREVPTALWIESTDSDDTNVPDVPIQTVSVDDEIVPSAAPLFLEPAASTEPIVAHPEVVVAPTLQQIKEVAPAPIVVAQPEERPFDLAPFDEPEERSETAPDVAAAAPSARIAEPAATTPTLAMPSTAKNGNGNGNSDNNSVAAAKPTISTQPAFTLPPAFLMRRSTTNKTPIASPAPVPVQKSDQSIGKLAATERSAFERDWRRVQPYVHGVCFSPTAPAAFYVMHVDASTVQDAQFDPPSFVALEPVVAPPSGLRALAEARKALNALEIGQTISGGDGASDVFARGTDHIQRGRFSSAVQQLQDLARGATENAPDETVATATLNTAYALGRLHRYEQALGVCDTLTRQFGEDTRPGILACVAVGLVNKASYLIALGRSQDAIDVCSALLSCSPPETDSVFADAMISARFNMAFALAQRGDVNKAVVEYASVAHDCHVTQQPGFHRLGAEAHYNLATIYHRGERRVETIEACDAAIALNAEHLRAHALRAASYLQLHLVGEALVALTDAFRAFPPRSVQRALILTELISESSQSAVLLRTIATTCSDDPSALACALTLWLRRQLPMRKAQATPFGIVEHALRAACAGTVEIAPVLDAMRALRRFTLGDKTAFEGLREDIRALVQQ